MENKQYKVKLDRDGKIQIMTCNGRELRYIIRQYKTIGYVPA